MSGALGAEQDLAGDYMQLAAETADLIQGLKEPGVSLVATVEEAALAEGLDLSRLPYECDTGDRDLGPWRGPVGVTPPLAYGVEGSYRNLRVYLPDRGQENQHWIRRPMLSVVETMLGSDTQLLKVDLKAMPGPAYNPRAETGVHHELEVDIEDGEPLIRPDVKGLGFIANQVWPHYAIEDVASKEFEMMARTVNALRGLTGEFEER